MVSSGSRSLVRHMRHEPLELRDRRCDHAGWRQPQGIVAGEALARSDHSQIAANKAGGFSRNSTARVAAERLTECGRRVLYGARNPNASHGCLNQKVERCTENVRANQFPEWSWLARVPSGI